MYHIDGDAPIGAALKLYGEWAGTEIAFCEQFIGPGDTVLDIGANIGIHSCAFAHRVGETGSVRAYEPNPRLARLIEAAATTNGLAQITVRAVGVGAAPGRLGLRLPAQAGPANLGALSLTPDVAEDVTPVTVVALDDESIDDCRFVKIDVERMEPEVLRGMRRLIARARPVLFVECNDVAAAVAVRAAVDWPDYRFMLLAVPAFAPDNFRGHADNIFGHACESALICLPAEVPPPTPPRRGFLTPTPDIDTLAAAVLRTPRYGDETAFDRDPAALRAALLRAEAGHERRAEREAAAETEAVLREEINRLGYRCEALSRRLERAERRREIEEGDLADRLAACRRAEAEAHRLGLLLAHVRRSLAWRATWPLRLIPGVGPRL